MRSIAYLTRGIVGCFADCLDYRDRHAAASVSMVLDSALVMQDTVLFVQLSGIFTWHFDTGPVSYEELFGGVLISESPTRQIRSVENANRRIDRRMLDFVQIGMSPEGRDERYVYETLMPRYA